MPDISIIVYHLKNSQTAILNKLWMCRAGNVIKQVFKTKLTTYTSASTCIHCMSISIYILKVKICQISGGQP